VVGCAAPSLETIRAHAELGQGHLVPSVPFVAQETHQCGPAALAMVLRYYGRLANPDVIAQALYLPSVRGTLNLELELYARRHGFRARSFPGSIEMLKAEIARDRPLVVFQDLGGVGLSVPHFAVLVGYDDAAGVVVLHSGTTAYRVVPYAEFERTWAARGRWTLLVTPGEA
jgi:ABC-type bacteriocin/lantibiotic exporter with double-glycine peptidase domain